MVEDREKIRTAMARFLGPFKKRDRKYAQTETTVRSNSRNEPAMWSKTESLKLV
jgi:hypothetical protein